MIVNSDKKKPTNKVSQIGHAGCLPDFRKDGGGSFISDTEYFIYEGL
jgi:hypothetical protein